METISYLCSTIIKKGVNMNKEEIKKLANIVEYSAINGYKAIIHSFFNENKENNKNEIVLNRNKCIGFHNGEYLYYPKRLFKVDDVLSLESDIENDYLSTLDEDTITIIDDMNLAELQGFVNFLKENL